MSKKSRKRNKKILGALAAGLGAMALMKRGKGASAVTGVVNPNVPKTSWISQKADTGADHRFDTKFSKPKKEIISKVDRVKNLQKNIAANYQRSQTFDAKPRFGPLSVPKYNVPDGIIKQYKKGGRVTGIAKRGFGRALMKGKK